LRSVFKKTRHSQPQFRKFGKCKQMIFFLSFSVKSVKMASQNTEKQWFELGVLKFFNFSEEEIAKFTINPNASAVVRKEEIRINSMPNMSLASVSVASLLEEENWMENHLFS